MAVKIQDFSISVSQMLDGYREDVREAVSAAVEQTGKKALRVVKKKSPVKTGAYKKGWRVKKEVGGIYQDQVNVTIYNAKDGPLVHLLEKGHQKVNGGRVEGVPHVQPAYDEAERLLPELVARAIEEAGGR